MMMEGKLNYIYYIPTYPAKRRLATEWRKNDELWKNMMQEINNDRCPQEPRFMDPGRGTLGLQASSRPNCHT